MTKEKVLSLTKYLNDMKTKLVAPLPKKHEGGERTYRQFLENEIKTATSRLDAAKMSLADAPKGK
jgi:hypothetical protein